jgi:hypothetical protein
VADLETRVAELERVQASGALMAALVESEGD